MFPEAQGVADSMRVSRFALGSPHGEAGAGEAYTTYLSASRKVLLATPQSPQPSFSRCATGFSGALRRPWSSNGRELHRAPSSEGPPASPCSPPTASRRYSLPADRTPHVWPSAGRVCSAWRSAPVLRGAQPPSTRASVCRTSWSGPLGVARSCRPKGRAWTWRWGPRPRGRALRCDWRRWRLPRCWPGRSISCRSSPTRGTLQGRRRWRGRSCDMCVPRAFVHWGAWRGGWQPAQPRYTNYWASRTGKQHQKEHRRQRPTKRNDPTQRAKGRTGDCPGPRKETTTRRNVTRGVAPGVQERDVQGGGGFVGKFSFFNLVRKFSPESLLCNLGYFLLLVHSLWSR